MQTGGSGCLLPTSLLFLAVISLVTLFCPITESDEIPGQRHITSRNPGKSCQSLSEQQKSSHIVTKNTCAKSTVMYNEITCKALDADGITGGNVNCKCTPLESIAAAVNILSLNRALSINTTDLYNHTRKANNKAGFLMKRVHLHTYGIKYKMLFLRYTKCSKYSLNLKNWNMPKGNNYLSR